jgi:hypothetical protein
MVCFVVVSLSPGFPLSTHAVTWMERASLSFFPWLAFLFRGGLVCYGSVAGLFFFSLSCLPYSLSIIVMERLLDGWFVIIFLLS